MNYRGRQVKLMWERDIKQKAARWDQERQVLQQDILNLQNSTDAKIIEGLEAENQKKQTLLNDTVNLLGAEDIKSLSDLQTLLEGKTLRQLKEKHSAQQNQLKQEINQLQQAKIETNQAYWKLEEELGQEKTAKDKLEKSLAKSNQSKERKKARLTQAEQKITDLETQLLNLAQQKLTNQKQARELLAQLEERWKEKQTSWEQTSQEQQDLYVQNLAQTKAGHQAEIRSLKQKHQTDQTRAIEQVQQAGEQTLQAAKENLEAKISSLELKLEVNQRERQEAQQTHQTNLQELKEFYQQKIQAYEQQKTTYQATISNLEQQIQAHQANLTQLTQQNQRANETNQAHLHTITETRELLRASQQENQTKQATIQNLNQDKVSLQTQITQLTQAQTENTRKMGEQQESIRSLEEKLNRQKGALEQLLTSREENFEPEMNVFTLKTWLNANPQPGIPSSLYTFEQNPYLFTALMAGRNEGLYKFATDESWQPTRQAVEKWKVACQTAKVKHQQEITLIKEALHG